MPAKTYWNERHHRPAAPPQRDDSYQLGPILKDSRNKVSTTRLPPRARKRRAQEPADTKRDPQKKARQLKPELHNSRCDPSNRKPNSIARRRPREHTDGPTYQQTT